MGVGLALGMALAVTGALLTIGLLTGGISPHSGPQVQPSVRSATSATVARPVPTARRPYVVRAGDTLERIARRSGVSVTDLLRWNPDIADPDYIDVGEAIQTRPPA